MIPTNWVGPSEFWPRWSNWMTKDISYGAPILTGPHKCPSHGYDYNPYHTIGNDPPQTFNMAPEGGSHWYDYSPYHTTRNVPPLIFSAVHGGPSHGYEYSPYHTIGINLPPTFAMAYEGPSHGYNYNLQNTVSNVPPLTFVVVHEHPSYYYDGTPYHSITNVPPPTFGPQATAHDREEEKFQRQLEEVTRQSQNDYTQKFKEDNYFLNM